MARTINEDQPESFDAWDLPDFEGDEFLPAFEEEREEEAPVEEEAPPSITAEEIEAIQKQAWDEAYERGKQEGFEFGRREGLNESRLQIQAERDAMQAQAAYLQQMLQDLAEPFAALDDEVEEQLVSLSIALVKQLTRREIKTDPGQVIAAVREGLNALPVSARQVRVYLHPEDAALVREAFSLDDVDQTWEVVEEPTLSRGGCRILTDTSRIEATLEARLNALIAQVFGGDRADDESH